MPTSAAPLTAPDTPILDIDNLSVSYNRQVVLKDISLAVYPGEFIGLIGPNGAGKSTFLKAILGLIPHRGSVRKHLNGVIGYVQQRGSIHERQTPINVLEIVQLGSAGHTALAKKALKSVNMSHHAHKRFDQLSGGQQQRVYIAKALASNPSLLILDEPTTGIDERSQTEFYQLLEQLQSQGIAIIMISHNIDTVLRLVKRVVCLNQTILYDGPPAHFEPDKYMPRFYTQQHRIIHHRQIEKKKPQAKPKAGTKTKS